MTKQRVLTAVFGSTLFLAGYAYGQRHPNLLEAQKAIELAWEKISAAQTANEFDMGGHAVKAKEHLAQARTEIKLAAEAANRH